MYIIKNISSYNIDSNHNIIYWLTNPSGHQLGCPDFEKHVLKTWRGKQLHILVIIGIYGSRMRLKHPIWSFPRRKNIYQDQSMWPSCLVFSWWNIYSISRFHAEIIDNQFIIVRTVSTERYYFLKLQKSTQSTTNRIFPATTTTKSF